MRFPHFWYSLLFLATLGFVAPTSALSEPLQKFSGSGTAIVIEGNQSNAENLARHSALRKAVAQAIEGVIEKGTKEELQYNVKKSELLKSPYPFVEAQKTLQSKVEGKLLTVVVDIQVNIDTLTRYLGQHGILVGRTEKRKRQELPVIMVLVGEEINGKEHRPSFCGNMLTKMLLEEEFSLVDQDAIQQSIKDDKGVQRVS